MTLTAETVFDTRICKVKYSHYGPVGPRGFSWRLRLPDSVTSALEDRRLSALCTGRLYPQEYPGTHFNPFQPSDAM
jgi:hypothetical protein